MFHWVFYIDPKWSFQRKEVDEEGRQAGWVVWWQHEGPKVSWRSRRHKGESLEVLHRREENT